MRSTTLVALTKVYVVCVPATLPVTFSENRAICRAPQPRDFAALWHCLREPRERRRKPWQWPWSKREGAMCHTRPAFLALAWRTPSQEAFETFGLREQARWAWARAWA